MAYIDPKEVLSPKNSVEDIEVVYDSGPVPYSWSVVTLKWEGKDSVGIRWNGDEERSKGTPQSRGNPTWFIVPEELSEEVLRAAQELRKDKQQELMAGYRAMAADREREQEAEEWSEALIGDSSEAR